MLRKIECFIQPSKLDKIKDALPASLQKAWEATEKAIKKANDYLNSDSVKAWDKAKAVWDKVREKSKDANEHIKIKEE